MCRSGMEDAVFARAPKAVKATHWLVPLRQAWMEAVWPSGERADGEDVDGDAVGVGESGGAAGGNDAGCAVGCQATFCALSGTPLARTRPGRSR